MVFVCVCGGRVLLKQDMVFVAPDPLLRFPREHLCDLLDVLGRCAQNWLMHHVIH